MCCSHALSFVTSNLKSQLWTNLLLKYVSQNRAKEVKAINKNVKSLTTLFPETELDSLVQRRASAERLVETTVMARNLRDVSFSERRKQASKPLYLVRYE